MTSLIVEQYPIHEVDNEIQIHTAWMGSILGLAAEKLLRGQKPFVYLLRNGEAAANYYITFVAADNTVRHQPFCTKNTISGWFYENGATAGPFLNVPFQEVIHQIMHCEKNACEPFKA